MRRLGVEETVIASAEQAERRRLITDTIVAVFHPRPARRRVGADNVVAVDFGQTGGAA